MRPADILETQEALEWLELVLVGKARRKPSILTDGGFLQSALRVARKLTQGAGVAVGSKDFVARVRASTQIDWLGATEAVKTRAIGELSNLIKGLPSKILPGARVVLDESGRAISKATNRALGKKYKDLRVDAVFDKTNERALDALSGSSAIFFADEYERRAKNFRSRAQKVIAEGFGKGLDPRAIAADLRAEFSETVIAESYWETAAANHVSRARAFSALATYAESGVEKFEWLSIVDSRTTELCQDLNGRVLSVKDALDGFDKLEDSKSLEHVKSVSPLMAPDATADEFIEAGGFAPPAHHRCRATTVPVFE